MSSLFYLKNKKLLIVEDFCLDLRWTSIPWNNDSSTINQILARRTQTTKEILYEIVGLGLPEGHVYFKFTSSQSSYFLSPFLLEKSQNGL